MASEAPASDQLRHNVFKACEERNYEEFKRLLSSLEGKERQAALEFADEHQMRPLHLASEACCPAIVSLCLRMGASPLSLTSLGNTPLHIAARQLGGAACVRAILFGAHADWSRVRLVWLGRRKGEEQCPFRRLPTEIIKIIANMITLGALDPYELCCITNTGGKYAFDNSLAWGDADSTFAILSVLRRDPQRLRQLVASQRRLMHRVANNADGRSVRILTECGAGVNELNERGETPLYCACCAPSERPDVIEALLAAGATKDPKPPSGRSALEEAWARGYFKIVPLLR